MSCQVAPDDLRFRLFSAKFHLDPFNRLSVIEYQAFNNIHKFCYFLSISFPPSKYYILITNLGIQSFIPFCKAG